MANEMKLTNPIIPGYYPDPSICRVRDDYYIANSSFEMDPGIPVFHSKDLVHWEQISNAVSRENGFHMERGCGTGGVMAPTLRYHNGTFYIMCCNFADGGNFIVTAKDPAGPWSEIHHLDDIPGIDASFFFDDDGQCYVMGTGNVWDNGAGEMERGIWLAKYDIENFKMAGEPFTIWNSALRGAGSPEAPHIYHIGDYYYLVIAEGGTEHYHSVTVARSKELFAFYEGNPANPVLTHRHMGFHCPIINVGHADLVDLPDGSWYAVMLASRLLDGAYKNLGRETFICPVTWERDWPVFTPETGKVEWSYPAPACLAGKGGEVKPENARDYFDDPELPLYMTLWGTPGKPYHEIRDSRLFIDCVPQAPDDELERMDFTRPRRDDAFAAFVARRQRQPKARVMCRMEFMAFGEEEAGLAVVQALNHQLHLVRASKGGRQVIRAEYTTADFNTYPYLPGFEGHTKRRLITETVYDRGSIVLAIEIDEEDIRLYYGPATDDLTLLGVFDGRIMNPEKVGCMTGTMIGMYATARGGESKNRAAFDFFELKQ